MGGREGRGGREGSGGRDEREMGGRGGAEKARARVTDSSTRESEGACLLRAGRRS